MGSYATVSRLSLPSFATETKVPLPQVMHSATNSSRPFQKKMDTFVEVLQ